ncbi:barstar family protein [Micrococcales bacterium 31B]|nr:barstar family protein [Micrococcales bacterium 31B]
MEKYVVLAGQTREQVLTEFARALKFPEYYGRNLDALADCLGDLSWLPPGRKHIEWWVDPEFEAGEGVRLLGTVRAIVGSTLGQRDDVTLRIRSGAAPECDGAEPVD